MPRLRDSVALPILVSFYAPLAAAAVLPGELLRVSDLVRPVGVTLVVAASGLALGLALTRQAEKAALISALLVTVFSWLGWAVGGTTLPVDGLMLVLVLTALALFLFAIGKSQRPTAPLVTYLSRVAMVLVAWNSGLVAWHLAHVDRLTPRVDSGITTSRPPVQPVPDIYLILLDKYSRADVLSEQYGFDNTPFEDQLHRRGFIVPIAARSNYVHTFLALGAMLNLRYLNDLPTRFGSSYHWELTYPLIENNRLAAFLHSHGYHIVTFPTEFGATRENRYADLQLPRPRDVRSEVRAAWWHATALPVVHEVACLVVVCASNAPPYLPASTDLMDWRFRTLASLPDSAGHPLFVFAHLLTPHEPYVYDEQCHHRPSYWPRSDSANRTRVTAAYLAQIRCVNTKVLAVVDAIRARSRVPPVILLQADHGHARLGRDIPALHTVLPAGIRDRTSVFAAYLLPGVPLDSVPMDISPINVARLVLRHYFGADLPPLPEATYWSSSSQPYQFSRVR